MCASYDISSMMVMITDGALRFTCCQAEAEQIAARARTEIAIGVGSHMNDDVKVEVDKSAFSVTPRASRCGPPSATGWGPVERAE